MRDLSRDARFLSINGATVRKQGTLAEIVAAVAARGIGGIAPWRNQIEACGLKEAARLIRDNGLTVTGLCRAGLFTAEGRAGLAKSLDQNRRAVDEAAAIGARCLVMLGGGLEPGSRDIAGARALARDGLAELLPHARSAGVALAIEPLHPMYAPDRSCFNTMAQANDLCDALGEGVGIAVDVYHVWWDPTSRARDRARGREAHSRLSHQRLAGADDGPAARPGHDGRRHHRHPRYQRLGRGRGLRGALRGRDLLRA